MVIFSGARRIHLFCVAKNCNFSVREWIDDFNTEQARMCPYCLHDKGKVNYLKWEYARSEPRYV